MENTAPRLISRLFLYMCVFEHDSPGNAEHHHTDDDHLECSDDRGDEDIVQFAGAWHHIEDVVLLDVTMGAPKTRVTAEITHTQTHKSGGKVREKASHSCARSDRFIIFSISN